MACVAAVEGPASAVPPSPPEHGLRGLRRIEVSFVEPGRGGLHGGIMTGEAAPARSEVAGDPDCRAIAPALARAGLEIVERCPAEDPACGVLLVTVESNPVAGSEEQTYFAGMELIQGVRLARDPHVALSVPTWSERRFGNVAALHSATRTSCIALRDLADWFAAVWKAAND
jgi:hypothetical protein